MLEIYKNLRYTTKTAKTFLYNHGDIEEDYYFLLYGEVWLLNKKNIYVEDEITVNLEENENKKKSRMLMKSKTIETNHNNFITVDLSTLSFRKESVHKWSTSQKFKRTLGVNFEPGNNDYDEFTTKEFLKEFHSQLEIKRKIKPGEGFGNLRSRNEFNLKKRDEAVICNTDCHFGYLPIKAFLKILVKNQNLILENSLNFLRQQIFFSSLNEIEEKKVFNLLKKKHYKLNETIYKENDISENVFIIENGEIEITKKQDTNESFDSNSSKKPLKKTKFVLKPIKVARLIRGEMFGSNDILQESNRTESAICVSSQCTLLIMSKNVVQIYKLKDFLNYADKGKTKNAINKLNLQKSQRRNQQIVNFLQITSNNTNKKKIENNNFVEKFKKLYFKSKEIKFENINDNKKCSKRYKICSKKNNSFDNFSQIIHKSENLDNFVKIKENLNNSFEKNSDDSIIDFNYSFDNNKNIRLKKLKNNEKNYLNLNSTKKNKIKEQLFKITTKNTKVSLFEKLNVNEVLRDLKEKFIKGQKKKNFVENYQNFSQFI